MAKKKTPQQQQLEQPSFTNTHRFARISQRKARLVVDMIRGMGAEEALASLRFSKKRAAVLVLKSLKAACANAEYQEADRRKLVVSQAIVGEGPTLKRFQPKDRGRAYQILKRTCHIKVTVQEG